MAEVATIEEVVAAVKEAVDEQIKDAVKQDNEELSARLDALEERVGAIETAINEFIDDVDKQLGASKAITDEPEGGSRQEPAKKSSVRRDAFGRRTRR